MSKIWYRDEWGSAHGRGNPTSGAKTRFIIHHDGIDRSGPESTIDEEKEIVQLYESFHAGGLTKANPRISYSFVVMQTGRIYEGCGWGFIGAHTKGLNSSAYAACLAIDGGSTKPTREAINAVLFLRQQGILLNHLSQNHLVSGHQDHGKPACPGKLVYDAIVVPARSGIAPRLIDMIHAQPSLRKGKGGLHARISEREVVRFLQQMLIAAGLLVEHLHDGSTAATGYFGPATHSAVIMFQKRTGLMPDGIVGAKTWAKLQ